MSFTIDDAIKQILAHSFTKKEKRETERERLSRERWSEASFRPSPIAYLFYTCKQQQKSYKWGIETRYPPIEK